MSLRRLGFYNFTPFDVRFIDFVFLGFFLQFNISKCLKFLLLFLLLAVEFRILDKMLEKQLYTAFFESGFDEILNSQTDNGNFSSSKGAFDSKFNAQFYRNLEQDLAESVYKAGFECRSVRLEAERKGALIGYKILMYCKPDNETLMLQAEAISSLLSKTLKNSLSSETLKPTRFFFNREPPSEYTEFELFSMALLFSLLVAVALPIKACNWTSRK